MDAGETQMAASRYAAYLAADTYWQQCNIYAEAYRRYGNVTAAADSDARTLAVECLKLRALLRIVHEDLANAPVSAGAVISKSIQEDASIVLGAIAEYRLHSEVDAAKRLAEFAIVVGLMDESVRPVRM